MRILFYYPDKERSVALSSLMIAFQEQGHQVFLLTHAPEGELHTDVKAHGVQTFSHLLKKGSSFSFYLKHIRFLISFTKKNKIDIVYSHIQTANIISCIARYFSPSRFILCRHHSDCAYIDNNLNERRSDRLINRFGKEFIVPSQKVYDQMVKVEKVKNKTIHLIRYAYDFAAYPKSDPAALNHIKEKYQAKLLLLKVARLISEKRHIILFKAVNELVKKGLDIKLLVLSEGSEKDNLEKFIAENGLQNHIFMLGYRNDIMNYISAADLVVHVSESEASNNLIKEAGYQKKPVVVCHDVGDFDEYLVNEKNAILLNKLDPETELEIIITRAYDGKLPAKELGEHLYETVLDRFSIEKILNEYKKLNAARN